MITLTFTPNEFANLLSIPDVNKIIIDRIRQGHLKVTGPEDVTSNQPVSREEIIRRLVPTSGNKITDIKKLRDLSINNDNILKLFPASDIISAGWPTSESRILGLAATKSIIEFLYYPPTR